VQRTQVEFLRRVQVASQLAGDAAFIAGLGDQRAAILSLGQPLGLVTRVGRCLPAAAQALTPGPLQLGPV